MGVIFSYNILSITYSILFSFDGTNGSYPQGEVVETIPNVETKNDQSVSPILAGTVYPNPVKDQMTITGYLNEISEINIYDILGNEILKKEFTGSITIQTTSFTPGVYFYQMNGKTSGKFLIEN